MWHYQYAYLIIAYTLIHVTLPVCISHYSLHTITCGTTSMHNIITHIALILVTEMMAPNLDQKSEVRTTPVITIGEYYKSWRMKLDFGDWRQPTK